MSDEDLIEAIGFKRHDVQKVIEFAKRQDMSVKQITRLALRRLQVELEPMPEIDGFSGCMGD